MTSPFYHVAKRSNRDRILQLGLLPTIDKIFATGGVSAFGSMLLATNDDPQFARALLDSGRDAGVNLTDTLASWPAQGDEVVFEVVIDADNPNLWHMHRWWWRYQGIIYPDQIRERP
jgi:hypothetical protein